VGGPQVGDGEPVGERPAEALEDSAVELVGAGGAVALHMVHEGLEDGDGGQGLRGGGDRLLAAGHQLVVALPGGLLVGAEVDLPAVELDVAELAAGAEERFGTFRHGAALLT
jgi:hypothetical protein